MNPEREFSLLVMGTSQGGLQALKAVLSPLPEDFPLPILVARHQHRLAGDYVLQVLGSVSRLPVRFAADGERPRPGHVYLAPPDRHLLVAPDGCLRLDAGPKWKHSRPAIDPLFSSATARVGRGLIAVLLTGANDDGCQGMLAIRERGGLLVVQDPASAEAAAMPQAAIDAGAVDHVVWLEQIGPFLWELVRGPVV